MPSREFFKRENILIIVAVLGVWSFLLQFTASERSLKAEKGIFLHCLIFLGSKIGYSHVGDL